MVKGAAVAKVKNQLLHKGSMLNPANEMRHMSEVTGAHSSNIHKIVERDFESKSGGGSRIAATHFTSGAATMLPQSRSRETLNGRKNYYHPRTQQKNLIVA